MKTYLPKSITTIEEAKSFLIELCNNDENFHPEDDAHDIEWINISEDQIPTIKECDQLNKLMNDIYHLPCNSGKYADDLGFDPCGFILDYLKLTVED